MKEITLHPGEYCASRQDVLLRTLLGSCISACLYDPVTRVIGMNHFLLTERRYSEREKPLYLTEAGRYGVHAMELLINDMIKLGGRRENLRAKVFGGSSLLGFNGTGTSPSVGELNCRFIIEFLENDGIPLVASSLGGHRGRVIRFSSLDFSVLVRKLGRFKVPEIVRSEKQYLRQSEASRTGGIIEPDVWD